MAPPVPVSTNFDSLTLKKTFKALLCTFITLANGAGTLEAQDVDLQRTFGDSTLKEVIGPQTRAIYDQDGELVYVLTRSPSQGDVGAYATELQGKLIAGHIRRIVATEWRTNGKYSVEYYFDEDRLLFAYEAFEYFEESRPVVSWRNFKGLAAWERRSYYEGRTIGYAEAVSAGEVEPGADAENLLETAVRLRAILQGRIQR